MFGRSFWCGSPFGFARTAMRAEAPAPVSWPTIVLAGLCALAPW